MNIRLLLLAALATAGCSTLPSQPPPFDRIRLGMTEAEAIAQLGETPLTHALPTGYTARCWFFDQPDGSAFGRCLAFDPHHRLIDVAGDGVDDDFPAPPASGSPPPPRSGAAPDTAQDIAPAPYPQDQTAFEQRLFVEAGFEPLETVAASGRSVRRALFHDGYFMFPAAGVEVEKHADGRVTLLVIGRGPPRAAVDVDPAVWTRLTELEGDLFAPIPRQAPPPEAQRRPLPPAPPPPVPISCHAWMARFGVSEGGHRKSGSWTPCSRLDGPGPAYLAEFARLAVNATPDCVFDAEQPIPSFNRCYPIARAEPGSGS